MKQEIINYFIEKNFLISPDLIDTLKDENISKLFINSINNDEDLQKKITVINKDLFSILPKIQNKIEINWNEFEKSKVMIEHGRNDNSYNLFLDILNYNLEAKKKKELDNLLENVKKEENIDIEVELKNDEKYSSVIILKDYDEDSKKRSVNDFVEHFKLRYNLIKGLLQSRQDLQNIISINRILGKKEKDPVSFIGMVYAKKLTKNKNMLLTLEDPTGSIDVLVNKEGKAIENAKNVVEDEIIAVNGVNGGRVVFATQIIFPDVPLTKELKKSDDEAYAVFVSDLHFGSKLFLKDDFLKFLDWLNCKSGSFLQKRISSKVKYMFVVGDVIDGIGVYPGQETGLVQKDVIQQYNTCAEYLGMIRKDIKIIISPGQHDSIRTAEPQPKLDKEFAYALHSMSNVVLVSNPCLVNIHSKKDFDGFNVMMYHGASYHHYIDEIDSLRQSNAKDNPTQVIKFLLQKRHLAPTHSSTVYVPTIDTDPLFIDKLPDIIVSGEMHRSDVANYNNVTLINCSCFQAKTPFEEKVGNNPMPSRVPILNLKTREVKIINFSSEE